MPKAQVIQINWQFTGSAGIMQVEYTADCFGGTWFKSPLSTEVWLWLIFNKDQSINQSYQKDNKAIKSLPSPLAPVLMVAASQYFTVLTAGISFGIPFIKI